MLNLKTHSANVDSRQQLVILLERRLRRNEFIAFCLLQRKLCLTGEVVM
jgi:hypothetical protein